MIFQVKRKFLFYTAFLLTLCCISLVYERETAQAAENVTIRYNGKKYSNKSKKRKVRYNGKVVSQNAYKALKIKKVYMVSYEDVFRNGLKAKCTYTSSRKELTITGNSVTVKMTIGSKKASVNGKTVTMPAAPLSVYYVAKKKTKIVVPVKFVAETLHLSYSQSGSYISLGAPLELQYDGETHYYTGVQGTVSYAHKSYTLTTMPVIKLSGNMYMPAKEVFTEILNLDYSYNRSAQTYSVTNEDLGISLEGTINSDTITVNGTEAKLNVPAKLIKNVSRNIDVVCLPIKSILGHLKYSGSWNKKLLYYTIQPTAYMEWKKALTDTQTGDTSVNYIHEISSAYSEQDNTGSINVKVQGSAQELMKTLTVKRDNKLITVTIPASEYLLEKNQFSNFGEVIEKCEITTDEAKQVVITFTCDRVIDYSYVIQNGTLELNLLFTTDGSTVSDQITNYSLTIKKPENVTIDDVSNEDQYKNKKFKIKIKGDHTDFYKENPVVINNNSVRNISISQSGSNTVITVTTSSLRGYKIYEQGNNFVVSLGAPRDIYSAIVVLDAGHGDFDPGAQNNGTNEKDLNYKILYTLMKDYFSQNAPSIKVYWTRKTDSFITLAKRAAFAKKVDADVFISLHMNSATNTSANGTEVYYSVSNNSKSFSGLTSQLMAAHFKDQLIGDLGTKNRGTKSAAYYVLKHNTVPSILIELGFLSGNSDYKKLTDTAFQQKAAKSIYDGIVSLFAQYDTGR